VVAGYAAGRRSRVRHGHVRFALEGGHHADQVECPLRARTGLMHRSKKALFDHLVGAGERAGTQDKELEPEDAGPRLEVSRRGINK
jgi:hypothetical protein